MPSGRGKAIPARLSKINFGEGRVAKGWTSVAACNQFRRWRFCARPIRVRWGAPCNFFRAVFFCNAPESLAALLPSGCPTCCPRRPAQRRECRPKSLTPFSPIPVPSVCLVARKAAIRVSLGRATIALRSGATCALHGTASTRVSRRQMLGPSWSWAADQTARANPPPFLLFVATRGCFRPARCAFRRYGALSDLVFRPLDVLLHGLDCFLRGLHLLKPLSSDAY